MKHKKMRGVVAMLLTLVMVVGMLPTSVYAAYNCKNELSHRQSEKH